MANKSRKDLNKLQNSVGRTTEVGLYGSVVN